jgi:hypothetical protein
VRCAFCSAVPVVTELPVAEGTAWAACAVCYSLIVMEDKRALAKRGAEKAVGYVKPDIALAPTLALQEERFWSVRA